MEPRRIYFKNKNTFYIKLKNRRIEVNIEDDTVNIMTVKLIKTEEVNEYKNAGFHIYKNRVAVFLYRVSIEAFEEIIGAYAVLK